MDDNIIFRYSRKQAIEDGIQTCISDKYPSDCRLYKYPVFFTNTVMALLEGKEDPGAIVWDIVFMSVKSPMKKEISPSMVEFGVLIQGCARSPDFIEEGINGYKLIVEIGPKDFDDPSPVVTVMFPEEV